MKHLFFSSFLLVFSATLTNAIPYNQWWTKGNQFYTVKQYDSAAVYYEKIAATKPENATVYYNLGNAYYKLNRVALSILNYKRALRLEPNYRQAKDNLILAQNRLSKAASPSKDIFFITWWNALSNASLAQFWAVVCWLVFLAFLVAQYFKRFKNAAIHPGFFYTATVLFFLVMLIAAVSAKNNTDHSEAVVMQAATFLKTNNGKVEMIPEGTIVKWNFKKGTSVAVELSDGRSGWIQAAALEKI
jgi:tetratricopeptide (TPR) repeat protein